MKRIILLSLFLSTAMVLSAQTADKKWAVGLGAGAYYGNTLEGTGFSSEFYLSRYLNSSFDLMLLNNLGFGNSEIKSTLDMGSTFLNLRYKLNNGYIVNEESAVQPYLYAGPGYIQDNETESLNWNAGLGFKFPLSSSVALFVEGGFIEGLEGDKATDEGTFTESFWKGIGGIEISFGKPKDSDLDGVPDRKDDCPDTPAGVVVDENGCPVDTDGDGLPDYKDDCPTEPGDIALNGCPDTDGDGVVDKDDDCPAIPGLKEFNGCPDTDGDGVIDTKDKCPDTPKGYKVDAKGCPIDTDGDGLLDEEDDCPTVVGPKENKGCPYEEPVKLNLNFEPVLFPTDQSALTSSAKAKIDEAVIVLKKNPTYVVNVYGHADERASAEYNMKLSQDRAAAAVTYLKSKGIGQDQIMEVKGYGETKPIAPNTTKSGLQQNRRVELQMYENK